MVINLKTANQIGLTIPPQRAGASGQGDSVKLGARHQATRLNRRIFDLALGSLLFAICVPAQAQQPDKMARIGYLSGLDRTTDSTRSKSIWSALRELGYLEGHNITVEYRYGEGKESHFRDLAAELARLKVDVIVAAGGDSLIRAVKNATKTIPIVMVGPGLDPVEAGIVESLARPGGNITGLTILSRELPGKRLELLKEVVPRLSHVAILYDNTVQRALLEANELIPSAARSLRLVIRTWNVANAGAFEKVFAGLAKEHPDALYIARSPLIRANEKRIANFALKSRLPSVYDSREAVNVGGLIYYGADLSESYRRVAYFVDKLLKGSKPADLPVEQPTKFEFIINLKTANQIGLIIPPNVLARADRVIK